MVTYGASQDLSLTLLTTTYNKRSIKSPISTHTTDSPLILTTAGPLTPNDPAVAHYRMLQLAHGVVHLNSASLTRAAARSGILELGCSTQTLPPQTRDHSVRTNRGSLSASQASSSLLDESAVATDIEQNRRAGGGFRKVWEQHALTRQRAARIGQLHVSSPPKVVAPLAGGFNGATSWTVGPSGLVAANKQGGMQENVLFQPLCDKMDCAQAEVQGHITSIPQSVVTVSDRMAWNQPLVSTSTPASPTSGRLAPSCSTPIPAKVTNVCKRKSLLSSSLLLSSLNTAPKNKRAEESINVFASCSSNTSELAVLSLAHSRSGTAAASAAMMSAAHSTSHKATTYNSCSPDGKHDAASLSKVAMLTHSILSAISSPKSSSRMTGDPLPDSTHLYPRPERSITAAGDASLQPMPLCEVSAGLLALSISTHGSNLLAQLDGSVRNGQLGGGQRSLMLDTRRTTSSKMSGTVNASTPSQQQPSPSFVPDPFLTRKSRSRRSASQVTQSPTQQLMVSGSKDDSVCGVCLDLPDAFELQVS